MEASRKKRQDSNGSLIDNRDPFSAKQHLAHASLITRELRLVDAAGKTRMLLSTLSGQPELRFLLTNGTPAITAELDRSGLGSIRIENPNPKGPAASIEIDDKGAHVKFDHPGGASSYCSSTMLASQVLLSSMQGDKFA